MKNKEPQAKKRIEPKILSKRQPGNTRGPLPQLYQGRKITQYEKQWVCIARTNPFYHDWSREQLLDLLYRKN
jgi:hypothetical protein